MIRLFAAVDEVTRSATWTSLSASRASSRALTFLALKAGEVRNAFLHFIHCIICTSMAEEVFGGIEKLF